MAVTVSAAITWAAALLLSAEVTLGAFLRSRDHSSCSPLKNHGTFSTVEVLVGTPPQKFDLVADTGSNDIIVQSCTCQDTGSCPKGFGPCFRGTNKSTSFVQPPHSDKDSHAMLLSFGSGQIVAVPASDKVQIGDQEAYMNDSLLLMVNQALNIRGQFEGILGLGRPTEKGLGTETLGEVPGFLNKANVDKFSMCFKEKGDGVLGLNTPLQESTMGSVGALHWSVDFQGLSVGSADQKVLFCSPDSKEEGQETACGFIPDSGTTLMMGPEKQILSLYEDLCNRWDRCKKTHEGLLREIEKLNGQINSTTSEEHGPLYLLQHGQDPSGEIGYEDIVKGLKDALAGAGSLDPSGIHGQSYGSRDDVYESGSLTSISPSETFQLLLENCETWMGNNTSVDFDTELPSLFFHAAGSNASGKQVLEMRPTTYILKSTQEVVHREIKKLMGILPVQILEKKNATVCMPAFGKMEYPTEKNGDVWILGTPLFYEFNVHYDRSAKPPSIAFVQEDCGHCQTGKRVVGSNVSLLRSSNTDSTGLAGLRQLNHAPVVGRYDTSLPL